MSVSIQMASLFYPNIPSAGTSIVLPNDKANLHASLGSPPFNIIHVEEDVILAFTFDVSR